MKKIAVTFKTFASVVCLLYACICCNHVLHAQVESEAIDTGISSPKFPRLKFSGYADIGYFWPDGDGTGFVIDTGGIIAADFPSIPTAGRFIGDPWATPVNSRGDPADTSGSLAFPGDPINSGGRPSAIINEVNLDLLGVVHPDLYVIASIDFYPRRGLSGIVDDSLELDLAYMEWVPFSDDPIVTFYFGKYDSAFGREYRFQESPDRTGISPSLIFRYVGGHPLGIKARAKFFSQAFIINFAVNTGSSHTESFNFSEEIDSNSYPSLSGRISYSFDIGEVHFDIGGSGEWGPQSQQPDNSIFQWQVGGDLLVVWRDLEFVGEYVNGEAPGGGSSGAPSLDFEGAYAELHYQLLNWFTPYFRWGFRDATHLSPSIFVYEVDIMRLTYGARFDITSRVIAKAEYLHNLELDPSPNLANDLILTSAVFKF